MADIKTTDQFQQFFMNKLEKAINILEDEIHTKLRENISAMTYGYAPNADARGPINKAYEIINGYPTGEPSYEFRDEAWVKDKAKQAAKAIIGSVWYDYQNLSAPSSDSPYTHGNYYQGKDRRAILAELLNVNGYDKQNDMGGKRREPFFDETIKWITNNWDKLCKKALSKVGLNVTTK